MQANSPSILTTYREMGEISDRMVVAAHAGEWEYLVTLENSLVECRERLASQDINTLDNDERAQSVALIRHVLENHTEIQEHIQPWLEHIRQFLGDGATRRKIAQAYGVE